MKERILTAITSKKFFCLLIAVILNLLDKMTGDNVVWVMAVYMGVEVVQKAAQQYLGKE